MHIAVVDGQGGGIGKVIVEKLRATFGYEVYILGLGTNALATSLMLKAGAEEGATGENAILYNIPKADIILGSIAIISANSLLGELSPAIAKSISESSGRKILIPLNKCNLYIAGVENKPLPHYIDDMITIIKEIKG